MAVSLRLELRQSPQQSTTQDKQYNLRTIVWLDWTEGEILYDLYGSVQFNGQYHSFECAETNYYGEEVGSQVIGYSDQMYTVFGGYPDYSMNPKTISYGPAEVYNDEIGTITTPETSRQIVHFENYPRYSSYGPAIDTDGYVTFDYYNNAGENATVLQGALSMDGVTACTEFKDLTKTGTSGISIGHHYPLASYEYNVFYRANRTTNYSPMRRIIKAVIGGEEIYVYSGDSYLNFDPVAPTFDPEVVDTDPDVIALTGNENTLVRHISDVQVEAYPSYGKYARSGEIYIQNINGTRVYDEYGEFPDVPNNVFYFYATDSRGNFGSLTYTHTPFVDYKLPTCNIDGNRPNTKGELTFQVFGESFKGSFGAVTNTLQVFYRYRIADGAYSDYIEMEPVIADDGSYRASVYFGNLDYQTPYYFEAYAVDKVTTTYSEETLVRSTPVFDWSKDDFNVNVDIGMNGDAILQITNVPNRNLVICAPPNAETGIYFYPNGAGDPTNAAYLGKDGNLYISGALWDYSRIPEQNPASLEEGISTLSLEDTTTPSNVLWSGALSMGAEDIINLSAAISAQRNGITLVFSDTEGNNISSFNVSKETIANYPNKTHSFTLSDNILEVFASKSLVISDAAIIGHAENNASGTKNGITYDNSQFILCQVIGY